MPPLSPVACIPPACCYAALGLISGGGVDSQDKPDASAADRARPGVAALGQAPPGLAPPQPHEGAHVPSLPLSSGHQGEPGRNAATALPQVKAGKSSLCPVLPAWQLSLVTVGHGLALVSALCKPVEKSWRAWDSALGVHSLSIPFQDDKCSVIKIRSSTVHREKLQSFRVSKCNGQVFTSLR